MNKKRRIKVEILLTEDEYKELDRLRKQAGQQWKTYIKNLVIRNSKKPRRNRLGLRRRRLIRRKQWWQIWK